MIFFFRKRPPFPTPRVVAYARVDCGSYITEDGFCSLKGYTFVGCYEFDHKQ